MSEVDKRLRPFVEADGVLKQMPRKAAARQAALDMLIGAFAFDRPYSEAEVNERLGTLHTFGDPALLRRELYDSGRFTRTANGKVYHRLRGRHGPIRLRQLTKEHDADHVAAALDWVGDYVELETGRKPSAEDVADFFDAPKGIVPPQILHLAILDAEAQSKGLLTVLQNYPEDGLWFIAMLAIDIRARGQGYARAAAEWVADQAGTAGATALRLCVIEENARGQAFWRHLGFEMIGETPPWNAGRKTHRRFILERRLASEDATEVPNV